MQARTQTRATNPKRGEALTLMKSARAVRSTCTRLTKLPVSYNIRPLEGRVHVHCLLETKRNYFRVRRRTPSSSGIIWCSYQNTGHSNVTAVLAPTFLVFSFFIPSLLLSFTPSHISSFPSTLLPSLTQTLTTDGCGRRCCCSHPPQLPPSSQTPSPVLSLRSGVVQ